MDHSPFPDFSSAPWLSDVLHLAAASDLFSYPWKDRGPAPPGYLKGMAVAFAGFHEQLRLGHPFVLALACAETGLPTDALTWYRPEFDALGLPPAQDSADTLRHLFTLLLGLGMRESSGRYCEGRDRSARNTSAETAEAGLFQTSWNARLASPLLPPLPAAFTGRSDLLPLFREGVHPMAADLENFGDGPGRDFQSLTKNCPLFALAFAALAVRHLRPAWGTLNRREVELRPEADLLFRQIQDLIGSPGVHRDSPCVPAGMA